MSWVQYPDGQHHQSDKTNLQTSSIKNRKNQKLNSLFSVSFIKYSIYKFKKTLQYENLKKPSICKFFKKWQKSVNLEQHLIIMPWGLIIRNISAFIEIKSFCAFEY